MELLEGMVQKEKDPKHYNDGKESEISMNRRYSCAKVASKKDKTKQVDSSAIASSLFLD